MVCRRRDAAMAQGDQEPRHRRQRKASSLDCPGGTWPRGISGLRPADCEKLRKPPGFCNWLWQPEEVNAVTVKCILSVILCLP